MTFKDAMTPVHPARTRLDILLDQYVIGLSVVMMLFGLRQWAIILGLLSVSADPFQEMATPLAVATVHMAIVDLVSSVGLWMRAAWGKVVWVYAAVFEIVIHSIFIGTFGASLPLVAFHIITLAVFIALTILARRARPR
jgi:hypothetical protein